MIAVDEVANKNTAFTEVYNLLIPSIKLRGQSAYGIGLDTTNMVLSGAEEAQYDITLTFKSPLKVSSRCHLIITSILYFSHSSQSSKLRTAQKGSLHANIRTSTRSNEANPTPCGFYTCCI